MTAMNDLTNAVAAWFEYIDADEDGQLGDAHLEGTLLEAMRAALANLAAKPETVK